MSTENTLANPAPVGLLGFGMTTILLNLHNLGFFPIASVILAMGIFVGGLAQVIVGILEFKRGNSFGFTAFTAYGFFWLSLVAIWVLPKMGLSEPSSHAFVGWYLVLWGIFSLAMHKATFNKSVVLRFIFAIVTVLFFMLALANFTGWGWLLVLSGLVGVVCGGSAFYLALAEILHGEHGRKVLPY